MTTLADALHLRRTYPHSRELVFSAWTEVDRLEEWFCPNPNNRVEASVDLRVGGAYRIAMIPEAGDSWVVSGVYEEIVRPERLVFSWMWQHEPEENSLVTMEFIEIPTGTEVLVTHERMLTKESREGHEQGWLACLDRLTRYLSEGDSDADDAPEFGAAAGTAAAIAQAKQVAAMSIARLKDTFSHVPNERLDWRPTPTSRSALKVAAHAALSNRYFASVLRGDPPSGDDMNDTIAGLIHGEANYTTRGQVDELLEVSSREVMAAYERLTPEALADPRVAFIATLVGRHTDGHAAQIDYIQTTWGDMEDHFGMP